MARRESAGRKRKQHLLTLQDFIILFYNGARSMLLRSAASALLRTTTEISSLCLLSTVHFGRQSHRCPLTYRPFFTSVCLQRKRKKSLWLQLAEEGQTMDGNVEEILAPLRLAVKEQVIAKFYQKLTAATVSISRD